MKTEEFKEEIKNKIKKLRENHIIRNGFPVSDCGYNYCYYKKRIKKLKQKLKENENLNLKKKFFLEERGGKRYKIKAKLSKLQEKNEN